MKQKEKVQQKNPGTMMLYATNNSIIKQLIEDREYNANKSHECRNPIINRFGFIGSLLNGFISDGNNKLEINFHEKTDLSLTQKKGFSLFFWFLAKKQPQGSMRYIIKQGNSSEEITPSIGFLPNSVNLFVKMLSSKNRVETLYSSKNIEPNRLYSLCVTFSIDYENDLTDILLYLDGILDSQISVPGEPLHNQGKTHLGKVDKNSLGFIGFLADVLTIPRPMEETEILQISKACIVNLINNTNNNTNLIKSYEIFERKFERDILMEKYSQHTGSPISVLENLDLLNDELREIVRKYDEDFINCVSENNEETQNDLNTYSGYNIYFPEKGDYVRFNGKKITLEEDAIVKKLQYFLGEEDSEGRIFFRKIAMNATFIFSTLFLLSEDQENLSPKRIINSFEIMNETMHLTIDETNLINLAKILNAYENSNINFLNMIKSIHYYSRLIYSDMNLNAFKNVTKSGFNSSGNNFITQMPFSNQSQNFGGSSTGFYNNNNNNNFDGCNSVDLHENFLFKSSRQFQNFEEELENNGNFMKSTVSIKTLYSRPKTGTRPGTTRGFGVNPITNSGDDYVNQVNFDEIDEMNANNFENSEKENNDTSNKDPNKMSMNANNMAIPENNNNSSSEQINNNNFSGSQNQNHQTFNVNEKGKIPESHSRSKNESNIQENAFDSADMKMDQDMNNNMENNNYEEENYEDKGFDGVDEEIYGEENNNKSRSRSRKSNDINNINEEEKKSRNSNEINNNNEEDIVNVNNGMENSNKENKSNKSQMGGNMQHEENNNNKSQAEKEEIAKENNEKENLEKEKEKEKEKSETFDKQKNEFSGMVSDLDKKMLGKSSTLDEAKEQYNDEENAFPLKQSQMIDNNIQVDGNKIEEEYKDENVENMQIDMEMEMEEQISVFNLAANHPDDWNLGEFEVIINHCFDCHKHKTSTRHYEYHYVEKFNEVGDWIKDTFPNVRIMGNFDKQNHLGCFDIYIRGVGPILDDKGRYWIFSKKLEKKFPTKNEVMDKLITLSMLYGSSVNMEAAQNQYIRAYSNYLPKQNPKMHDHPENLSPEAEEEKAAIDPDRTKLFCTNPGCGVTFVQAENKGKPCTYHPGVWQFGSYNALWPEAWSCCERDWADEGCTKGLHKEVRLDKHLNLCLNFGAINPRTGHPDSACGASFTKDNTEGCKIHPGFFSHKSQSWTCCDMGELSVPGCQEEKHTTYHWPDEKAKLYFYPKALFNPGLNKPGKGPAPAKNLASVGQQICKCDFFKPIKSYENVATKFELLKMKREKEKEETRHCVHWGCDKYFKESTNTEKGCLCHPGKWDHGSTGTKMEEFISEFPQDPKDVEKKKILWRPHWTCCGGEWERKGCTYMAHSGPLCEEGEKSRKYLWPDCRAKLFFPKVVSNKWKKNLEQYTYSEDKVKRICHKFFSQGKRSTSELYTLCDELKLYLLVVNDKIDYTLKFMDVATQTNSIAFFSDSSNNVDPAKFITWWFEDYENIINAMTVPQN